MPTDTFFNLNPGKKNYIIEQGKLLFSKHKYEEISIKDITKSCGISVGSFYQYFTDKDEFYIYLSVELEKKILNLEEKYLDDLMFSDKVIFLPDDLDEIDKEFSRSWENVTVEVMQKFYFNEYFNLVKPIFKSMMEKKAEEGVLNSYVDIDFFVYMYITSIFNINLYFRNNNITDEKIKFKMKIDYLRKILYYGIVKKTK